MRIFILLLILIAFNTQAKKQKTIDIYLAPPPFRAVLIKPLNVDLHYPIPYLEYDPDRGKIVIKGKVFDEETYGIVEEEVILFSEFVAHGIALNYLLDQDKEPYKIFSDVINVKTQKAIAHINRLYSNDKEALHTSYDIINRSGILNFNVYLNTKGITPDMFTNFIIDTITVDKLHERVFEPKLPLTDNNIYDFTNFSNNQNYFSANMYTLLVISMPRNFFNIAVIKDLYSTLFNNNLRGINVKFEAGIKRAKAVISVVKIDPNEKILNCFILRENQNRHVIGPIPVRNNLVFLKVLKKERRYSPGELMLKTTTCFIKKNTQQNKKISIYQKNKAIKTLEELKYRLIKNKKIQTSICTDVWQSDMDFSDNVRDKIAILEKNEVSAVIEDNNGWYAIKILEKNFSKKSIAFSNIHQIYRNEQLFLLLENYLKTLRRQAYKITYYDE